MYLYNQQDSYIADDFKCHVVNSHSKLSKTEFVTFKFWQENLIRIINTKSSRSRKFVTLQDDGLSTVTPITT